MKVLFLSVWYPTPRDPMSGLFVEKHLRAVEAQGAEVCVVYSEAAGMAWWKEMISGIRSLFRQGWRPDVVQVNVLGKNALIAYWLKRRYHIPYFIIEHWSGYLPENNQFHEGLRARWIRRVAREAEAIMPVSHCLEMAMKSHGIENAHWQVIRNVVDDFFYSAEDKPRISRDKCRLLHVSCFDEKAKNVTGLLRAVRQVAEHRQDFTLVLVGAGQHYDLARRTAEELAFPKGMLEWTGEVPPEEVCRQMQQSDAMIMFSRYENAPVVISEALAVGLPVIGSRVGGIPEMIDDTIGRLVESENETELAQTIDWMIDHHNEYDGEIIRRHALPFRFDTVGKFLIELYRS